MVTTLNIRIGFFGDFKYFDGLQVILSKDEYRLSLWEEHFNSEND